MDTNDICSVCENHIDDYLWNVERKFNIDELRLFTIIKHISSRCECCEEPLHTHHDGCPACYPALLDRFKCWLEQDPVPPMFR